MFWPILMHHYIGCKMVSVSLSALEGEYSQGQTEPCVDSRKLLKLDGTVYLNIIRCFIESL